MIYYLDLDEKQFITGWSSTPFMDGGTSIEYDGNPEDFMEFQYIEGRLVRNQERMIKSLKEAAAMESSRLLTASRLKLVPITINSIEYLWEATEDNRKFLERSYDLMSKKILQSGITLPLRKAGSTTEESVFVKPANIEELWILLFLKDEQETQKHTKRLSEIEKLETLEDVENYINEIEEFG